MDTSEAIKKIHDEYSTGMSQEKCKKCGCMKESLFNMLNALASINIKEKKELVSDIEKWQKELKPTEYACFGCSHCHPAFIANIFSEGFPLAELKLFSCRFEVKENGWPVVPGEYHVIPDCKDGNVAVTTLASEDLAEKIAKLKPSGLCIIGKTETENIGIDKVIKNVITNSAIKYLVVAGRETKGHMSGDSFISLCKNGIDEDMRIIDAKGKKPVLKNVSKDEIDAFLHQVEMVDLIGVEDEKLILAKINELSEKAGPSCTCKSCDDSAKPVKVTTPKVIAATEPVKVLLDKAGYFVIIPNAEKNLITVEHYSYDNKLLRSIEGDNARSIYNTIIKHRWVTEMFHAAYLGKELSKAELSIQMGFKYVQDGA
jgi:tetrahydromethanopterin S-methyltransferase subunit A